MVKSLKSIFKRIKSMEVDTSTVTTCAERITPQTYQDKTFIPAKDLHPLLSPESYPERLRVIKENGNLLWKTATAKYREVLQIMKSSPEIVKLICTTGNDRFYPHTKEMIIGLAAKARLERVLLSYQRINQELSALLSPLSPQDIVLDLGLGSGTMTIHLLGATEAHIISTGNGPSDLLGLMNLARAGYLVRILRNTTSAWEIPEGTNVTYMAQEFEEEFPTFLNKKLAGIVSDHAVVYAPDENTLRKRIESLTQLVRPRGFIAITGYNKKLDDMEQLAETFANEKGLEIKSIRKQVFGKHLFKALGRILTAIKAIPFNEPSIRLQLDAPTVERVLQEFGSVQTVSIQNDLHNLYILTLQ